MSARDRKPGGSVGDLVGALGKKAPFDLAEDWDNVGFLLGDGAEKARGVVVAVNLGPEALAAAEASGANVVVCHHPPIFKPVSRVTRAGAPYVYEALRRGISVVALHTNYDLCSETASRVIAERLGFAFDGFLTTRGGATTPRSLRLGKFITYVPEKNLDAVREAAARAGAGRIGDYSDCSFSWEGEGTFQGGEESKPAVGKAGRLERVRERRLEMVFPWSAQAAVLAAARGAHPYEEMAFDVLELAQPSRNCGYGFVGTHSKGERKGHLTFHKLVENAKETFQLRHVTVVGPGLENSKMPVERMAFSPGSGSSFVGAASAKGADVYVCGEIGYHQMLEARQKGLTLILLGHSYSERFFVETVSGWCEEQGVTTKKVFETVHETV